MGHDGREGVGEQAEQVAHEITRQKRHVAGGDKDTLVPGGE
jgi:hypothetical protein